MKTATSVLMIAVSSGNVSGVEIGLMTSARN
jgi:hypothetical protein